MFSNRFNFDLSDNRITNLLNIKKASGKIIFDLTESNPTKTDFNYDKSFIINAFKKEKSLIYNPLPKGHLKTRKSISSYYKSLGIDVNGESILLTSGTSEAYSFLFKLLANSSDEILIPQPGYPLFEFIANLEELKTVQYNLKYENGWRIDFDDMKRKITGQTKIIVIVNPNNPTGNYINNTEVNEINKISRDKNIAVISDEVFFEFILNEKIKPVSLAENNESLTFVLSGLSKICGLPQMKLGWICVNGKKKLKQQAIERLELISDTFLLVGTPVQLAAGELLKTRYNFQKQVIERIRNNYEFLKITFADCDKVKVLNSDGGWYAVLKIEDNVSDEDRIFKLLDEKNVFVHPGYFYDFTKDGYLVLSLITNEEIFKEGVIRLKTTV